MEKGKTKSKHAGPGKSFIFTFAFFLFTFALSSCALRANREGIPAELQSQLDTLGEDIADGRYEKIYNEAAAEWRRDSTLDESSGVFKTLKSKLGRVENRALHTATEERILSNMRNEAVPRTTILISHRTSTAKEADLIVVLDRGRIVHRAASAELLADPATLDRLVAVSCLAIRCRAGAKHEAEKRATHGFAGALGGGAKLPRTSP